MLKNFANRTKDITKLVVRKISEAKVGDLESTALYAAVEKSIEMANAK